jgi:hypothetical protein
MMNEKTKEGKKGLGRRAFHLFTFDAAAASLVFFFFVFLVFYFSAFALCRTDIQYTSFMDGASSSYKKIPYNGIHTLRENERGVNTNPSPLHTHTHTPHLPYSPPG